MSPTTLTGTDSDVSDTAPEAAHDKVLVCACHQAKGIERRASTVLGSDQGCHTWFDKTATPPTAASNPQYVAATRALECLPAAEKEADQSDLRARLSEAHCKDIHYTLNGIPAPAKISGRSMHLELIKYRKFPDVTHGGGPTSSGMKSGVIVTGTMDICRP